VPREEWSGRVFESKVVCLSRSVSTPFRRDRQFAVVIPAAQADSQHKLQRQELSSGNYRGCNQAPDLPDHDGAGPLGLMFHGQELYGCVGQHEKHR